MRRNEREGNFHDSTVSLLIPLIVSTTLLASICSDKSDVGPPPSDMLVPQPTPDLLAFREGAQCRELMEDIEGAYNESGLAVYDGKYLLRANPLDGTALRVMVLTSREKFEQEVDNFEEKLREGLAETNVERFPVEYYRVAKKIPGGGAIADESVESITIGERGIASGCFSPTPASPAASPAS